jgi:hypothetical protein
MPLNKKLVIAAKRIDSSRTPTRIDRVLASVQSIIYAKHKPVIVPNDPVRPSIKEPRKTT